MEFWPGGDKMKSSGQKGDIPLAKRETICKAGQGDEMQLWPCSRRQDVILCSWEVRYTLVLRFNPDTIHYAFRDQYTVCLIKNVGRKIYLCVDVCPTF
jgi:hypothetical protein